MLNAAGGILDPIKRKAYYATFQKIVTDELPVFPINLLPYHTLTNKRVVLRFGVALPKCVNVPLALVGTADVKPAGAGVVDVSLTPTVRFPLAYLQMWPHARPWKFGSPQPMLRAVPEAFVPLLADALAKADPARVIASPDAAPAPAMVGAAA